MHFLQEQRIILSLLAICGWCGTSHASIISSIRDEHAEQSSRQDTDKSEISSSSTTTESGEKDKQPWIKKWKPTRNLGEFGIFGGILRINDRHELFRPNSSLTNDGFKPLNRVSPELGLRLGFYPLAALGFEMEASLLPTQLRNSSTSVLGYYGRGQIVAQLPLASIVPFATFGAGVIGVQSERSVLGKDVDPAVHFGGGVKIYLSRLTQIRLDLRDVVTTRQGLPNRLNSHNFEALLGFSITLGRKKQPEAPKDSDGDGIEDSRDKCIHEAETFNGFRDDDGCPESDRDGDGFWDNPDQDACPDVPGVVPDGCPGDRDKDKIIDEKDKCPDDPETYNGFEDEDGCPDELPATVEKFSGTIYGIRFALNKFDFLPGSETVLDQAAEIMEKHPSLRIEITGHTDNIGDEPYNQHLGLQRAQAVKDYLVRRGIDADRIKVRSAAFHEPVADNENESGRSLNRRIEFKILTQ